MQACLCILLFLLAIEYGYPKKNPVQSVSTAELLSTLKEGFCEILQIELATANF